MSHSRKVMGLLHTFFGSFSKRIMGLMVGTASILFARVGFSTYWCDDSRGYGKIYQLLLFVGHQQKNK